MTHYLGRRRVASHGGECDHGAVMASRAADWLRQALRDLEHARMSLEEGVFEWAAFAASRARRRP